MSVPALRFKEFSGDWEATIFDEILEITRLAGYEYSTYWREDEKKEIIALRGYNVGKGKLDLIKLGYISNELSLQLKRSKLFKGDIVYPCVGTIGNAVVIEENDKYHIQQNIAKLTPKENISPYFIAQFLMSDRGVNEVYRFNATSSQPNILVGSLRNFRILIPSLPEQTKIANFLTAVDEKITLLTQKASLLSQYKKGVMQQIFSQELRFKDDDGQDFPEWSISSLEQVSINYYQGINTAADKTEYIDGGVPIIQAKHITSEYLDFSDARGLNQLDYEKYKEKYNPKINDLLISNIGTLGKIVLVESKIKFLIAWNIFKVTLDSQKCYPRYIREYLKNIASNGYFDSIKTGNATKFINKTDMLAIEIILPSLPEQTKIANFLTAVDEKITTNQKQLDAVKQYKQGLLQQMFA